MICCIIISKENGKMNNSQVKKIVDVIYAYIKYAMALFGVFCILGVLIPTKVSVLGYSRSLGNYFKMNSGGRAICVILFTLVCLCAVFAKDFKLNLGKSVYTFLPAVAVIAALLVVIIAGVAGLAGGESSLIHGGIKMIRWARIMLFLAAIINAACFYVKMYVFKDEN